MSIYYSDDSVTLYHGKAVDVLPTLQPGSVDCIVTSPPYYGLRDYGVDGQQGAERTPAEYVAGMVAVFAHARRALADDGTLWLNLGDIYSGSWGAQGKTPQGMHAKILEACGYADQQRRTGSIRDGQPPAKNLMGMPWRVAFALQDDGWTLRNDIIWYKPNAMPESITDRLSTKHEHLFLLTKRPRYWFNLDPIREPLAYPDAADGSRVSGGKNKASNLTTGSSERRTGRTYGKAASTNLAPTGQRHAAAETLGRNPGDVWSVPTQPFSGAHFATMPPKLAQRCIAAGCKPGGTVLDPYHRSGTTGMVAAQLGHPYIGIDLNTDYLDLSLRTRLAQTALLDGGVSA